ncbi:MAG TPA: hypothetical protein VER14_00775 [Phototrophicaceae bacterium]|nr:hypothetical protein [Phototrophicaceae bacterium]
MQFGSANLSFSQAVDLLPINTGNKALNGSLPVFDDCIEDAIAASENAHLQTTYFEDEPARNDVSECCQVLVDNPSVEQKGEAE